PINCAARASMWSTSAPENRTLRRLSILRMRPLRPSRRISRNTRPWPERQSCATPSFSGTPPTSDPTTRGEKWWLPWGGKHALFNAIQVLVDHGDEVILPVPYWVSFKDIIRYAGGNPVLVETDESHNFALTAEMVSKAVTPRTKLIILNSPSNPSGAVMKPEDMTAIIRMAHERGIWVALDECYVYLNYAGRNFSAGSLVEYRDRMVILGSLSKTYAMTGWRLGYALAPATVISAMAKLQSQSTSNPTSIVQKAAVAALNGPQQCVEDMRQDYIKLRDHVVNGLRSIPGVKCTLPEGAFYAYPNVSSFFGHSGQRSASDVA